MNNSIKYYLVALEYKGKNRLFRKIDEIKDIIHRENYNYTNNESINRMMIYNVNDNSIQILLRSCLENIDIKIELFKELINGVEEINDREPNTIGNINKILYKIELTETIANKMVIHMKNHGKKEFDLITAISFNKAIEDRITKDIESENKDIEEDDYSYRGRYSNRWQREENPKSFYNINEDEVMEKLNYITNNVKINIDLLEETKLLKKLCTQFNKSINYIIKCQHEDLCENEIGKLILSMQFKNGMSNNFEKITLQELLNPPGLFFGVGDREEIILPHGKRNIPLIICNAEEMDNLEGKDISKLINFIKNSDIPSIFIIDKSKINKNEELKSILENMKRQIIIRQIEVEEVSELEYYDNIKKLIEQRGYVLDDEIYPLKLIREVKEVYGNGLRISNIETISDYMIFRHIEKGLNTKLIKDFGVSINEEKDNGNIQIIESGIQKMNKMIGLKEPKSKMQDFIELYKINQKRMDIGLKVENISTHMLLTGNPGTGKTTFVRILAQVLKEEGILKKGHFIEVSRDKLISKYVGWTAKNVTEYFHKAKGGILFIDEAYLLATDLDRGFGKEAIGTIVKNMEDFRDDVIVVLAGYRNEMKELINSNPGIESRIAIEIDIDDYTLDELVDIFRFFCDERQYILCKEVEEKIYEYLRIILENRNKNENLGNARFVRKIAERIFLTQATRISKKDIVTRDDLLLITIEDLRALDDSDLISKCATTAKMGFIRG